LVGTDISAGGMLSPASLARGIAAGQWRIVRRTRLEGQPAIELSETSHGPDVIEPLPTLLWVSARTHLPIRMVNGVGSTSVTRNEWAYLPPTAANLKLLDVHIPPVTRVTSRSAEFFAWRAMAAWLARGGPGVPRSRAVDFVIGLDPGATGSRAVAVASDGRIAAVASAPGPLPRS
jgi:hypothetical protein